MDKNCPNREEECYRPEDRLVVMAAFQRCVEEGKPYDLELSFTTAKGRQLWIRTTARPVRESGKVMRVIGNIMDITERKRVVEELRNERKRLRAILDTVGNPIFVKDNHHRIVLTNRAFETIFGLSKDAVIGKTLAENVPADEMQHFLAIDRQVLDTGNPDEREESLTVNGITRVIITRKTRFIEESGERFLVGSIHDITERKQITDALLAAKLDADRANHAKSKFLAAASHDLRQPLAALALYVGVLQHRVEADNQILIGHIQQCCTNLSELLTDLLDVSKLDAGVIMPQLESFSVDEFMAALVSVHSAEAAKKGLHLHWRACGKFAHTDEQLLLRIVGNLMDNAICHTQFGCILIACRRHEGKHWLEVWDTGIGIAADKTGLIFEEFVQLGQVPAQRGSGLGLAIVAKTALLLGLQLRVRSRLGRGSMFAIELPLGNAAAAVEPIVQPALACCLRIGLVENDPLVLTALVLVLETAGHQVIAARSGQQLLDQLGQQVPDVLISDYRLDDGRTGFEVVMAAREAYGEALPALIITGDTDPALIKSMAERGITIHYKPLKQEVLLAFVNQIKASRPA
ncbi:MAG: PAS domain S-box protein [Rhodoferax sp.]